MEDSFFDDFTWKDWGVFIFLGVSLVFILLYSRIDSPVAERLFMRLLLRG